MKLKSKMLNIYGNWKLVVSSIAAVCLFLSDSRMVISACLIIVMMTIVFSTFFEHITPNKKLPHLAKLYAILMAISIGFAGFLTVYKYSNNQKVDLMFKCLGIDINTKAVVLALGIIAFVVSFYFFYVVSSWWVTKLIYSFKQFGISIQFNEDILKVNLKSNWYILLSVVCILCLPCRLSIGSLFGAVFGIVSFAFLIAQCKDIMFKVNKFSGICTKIFSMISAIGVCLNAQTQFITSQNIIKISNQLEIPYAVFKVVSSIFAILSILSVYIGLLWFYHKLLSTLEEINCIEYFSSFLKKEWVVYLVILLLFFGFIIKAYTISNVFYSEVQDYDIIYTSDSPELLRYNAYLSWGHPENDLRQPLFAVYSAPFMGAFYLIARILGIFGNKYYFEAIFSACIQAIILLISYLFLAKLLNIKGIKRSIFMIFNSITYTYLLFSVIIEQYIFAFFWLMLALNCIGKKKKNYFCICGAGGTLITSFIFLPYMSDVNPFKNLKKWISDMINVTFIFVWIMFLFGKFELLFNLTWKLSAYGSYMGQDISTIQIVKQFSGFILGCFFAPPSSKVLNSTGYFSWQLNEVTNFNMVGIMILFLAIMGCIVSWDNCMSKMMMIWIGFSVFLLVILGWGTFENGLILYALYFAWAYIGGLYQLLNTIGRKVKIICFPELIEVIVSVLLVFVNSSAIAGLLEFAGTYYPV